MKKQGKKILIGVLLTLLVGGLVIVFTLKYHAKSSITNEMDLASTNLDDNILNDNENIETAYEQNEESLEIIDQDIITENQEYNVIKHEESININEEKTNSNIVNTSDKVHITNNTTPEQVKDNEPQKNLNNNQTSKQNTTSKNNTPNISQNENKETNIKHEEKNEDTTQEKQEDKEVTTPPIPEEPKVEEETKEEIQEEPKKENVHSYKYNSTITEQIKQDILSNESDYMKQYGYTIVIDESIVTLTNQFTYTNTRVKDKIIKKFGTIRIYARDYYYNGEYMFTECYII